jgi:hypothetical protein
VKLADDFQIREHSWPCRAILVIGLYELLGNPTT